MKKYLYIITILILGMVILAGCGTKGEENISATATPEIEVREPVTYTKTIGSLGTDETNILLDITFDKTIPEFSHGWSQTAVYKVDKKSATDDGSGSMTFYADMNLEGSGLTHWFEYNFNVIEGCTYNVSFSYAGKSGGQRAHNYVCGVSKRANDHPTISNGEYDVAMLERWNIDWDNLTDGKFYQAPEITFTATETATYSVMFQLYGLEKTGKFWIDDIKVVEKTSQLASVVTFETGEYEDKYVYEIYGKRAIKETPEAPEREGQVFVGWYDFNGYLYDYTGIYTTDKTFYPIYADEEEYDTFEDAFNIQEEIPSIYIKTDNGAAVSSKHNYTGAKITIESANEKYCMENVHMQIRGRGNSSWYCMEKQSFRLKLDEKAKLLGMHSDRNYALISNHCDKSLLRNFLAYGFANSIEALKWTPECHYVNLTINGDFRGLYLLIETVREDNNRVDVSGVAESVKDTGFLVEQVPQGRMNDDLAANPDEVYVQAGGYYWNVKYPEREDFSSDAEFKAVKAYIKDTIKAGFEALFSRNYDNLSKCWDVEAFAEFWLLEELFANFDSFQASIFISKPMGGKLTFGPAWDFDIGANNISYVNMSSESWYLGETYSTIFGKAMLIKEFRELIFTKIKEYYDKEWKYYMTAIDSCADFIEDDWKKNYERWKYNEKVFETPSWILALEGYPEQVNYIKIWLNRHMVFLYNEASTHSGCESWPVND